MGISNWQNQYRVHVGSDVLGDNYHLADAETTDVETDFYTQLRVRSDGSLGSWKTIALDNRMGVGLRSLKYDFRGNAAWEGASPWEVNLDASANARRFHGSKSAMRSSFAEGLVSLDVRRPLPTYPEMKLGMLHTVQGITYGTRSSLYVNALRHWHGVIAHRARGLNFASAKIGIEHEFVPDSANLEYRALSGDLYGMFALSLDWLASGNVSSSYRSYASSRAHPNELSSLATGHLTRRLNSEFAVSCGMTGSILSFDPADSVYISLRNAELVSEMTWSPGQTSGRLGVGVGLQRSPSSRTEDYGDISIQGGVSITSLGFGFSDVSLKVGKRIYRYPGEALMTDYRYWDATALLSGLTLFGLRFEGFSVMHSEYHADSSENSRSLLLIVDISRSIGQP
jgi:hypothetical protein